MTVLTDIEHKLNTYPHALSQRLRAVRTLITEIATSNETIGTLDESLKWGQISIATKSPKSGTPIRIDGNADAKTYSIYVPCSTSLIDDFRTHHPDMFTYHGNREIRLDLTAPMPEPELTLFLTAALSYYLA